MKAVIFLFFLGIDTATTVIHSLKYFYTGSSGVPKFPEFVAVGLVDDVQVISYDSNTGRAEPKQDWMKKITADHPQHWEKQTAGFQGDQQVFKDDIDTAKQRFGQTGGVHVFQLMYGCEWDDETEEVTGFHQYGYDGEDWLAFDLNTKTWIAPTPQAFITKQRWDHNKALTAQKKNYLSQECPEWLKKYLSYGRSSLMRTVPPSVSLLQKTPSSPVSCHATGFYPNRAVMFWRKNGEELHEDVVQGEILPNHDGSFQKSIDLLSVKAEDWEICECVFQLSGLKDDIVTKLDKAAVFSNQGKSGEFPVAVVGGIVGVLILVAGAAGFLIWRKNNEKQKEPEKTSAGSVISSTESLNRNTPEPDTFSCVSSSSRGTADSDTPLMKRSN